MEDDNRIYAVKYTPVHNTSERNTETKNRRRPTHLLGLYGLFVLTLGTPILISAIAFLAMFWRTSLRLVQGHSATAFWMDIILNERAATTVTVTSAFVRTALSLQAGLSASMLAAIILERKGTSLWKLPIFSIIRAVTISPQVLAWPMLRRPLKTLPFAHTMVVLFMIAITAISHFTSTILLLDFAAGILQLPPNTTMIAHGFRPSNNNVFLTADSTASSWYAGLPVFPRFAEIHEPVVPVVPVDGVVDTGPSVRAFLPFSASPKRSALRSYSGPAKVMRSRVVCTRPTLSDLSVLKSTNEDDFFVWFAAGTAQIGVNFSILTPVESETPSAKSQYAFNCTIPIPGPNVPWTASNCFVGFMTEFNHSADADQKPGYHHTFLVFNATSMLGRFDSGPGTGRNISLSGAWMTLYFSGTWITLEGVAEDFSIRLSASLCFSDAFDGTLNQAYNVTFQSDRDFAELPLRLDFNKVEHESALEDVMNMACGSACSLRGSEDRGILKLDPPSNWTAARLNSTSRFLKPDDRDYIKDSKNTNSTVPIGIYNDGTTRGPATILETILRRTQNPALALQYLFTIMAQMAYYEYSPYFDAEDEATAVFSQSFVLPKRWTGLIVIASLVFAHFVLLGGVLVAFLSQTKMSLLGNSWTAVAQVLAADTDNTLRQASMLTDEEVRKMLRAEGKERTVRIKLD